jgi:hypothetical protein
MEGYGQGVAVVGDGEIVTGDGGFEEGHLGVDPLGEEEAIFIDEHEAAVVFEAFGKDFGGSKADAAEGFDGVDPDLSEGVVLGTGH